MPNKSTIRQYRTAWADFERVCEAAGLTALPAEPGTVLWYLEKRDKQLTTSTMKKRLAAIRHFHREAGHPPPDTGQTRDEDIRLAHNFATFAEHESGDLAATLSPSQKSLLKAVDGSTLAGARDTAMILFLSGFDLSREQCSALDVEDIDIAGKAVTISLKESESGTESRPKRIYSSDNATDPAIAIARWLERGNIKSGPLFRSIDRHSNVKGRLSGRTIYNIVSKHAAAAGLENFSPMNLRRVWSK